jgi:hypothetical protein
MLGRRLGSTPLASLPRRCPAAVRPARPIRRAPKPLPQGDLRGRIRPRGGRRATAPVAGAVAAAAAADEAGHDAECLRLLVPHAQGGGAGDARRRAVGRAGWRRRRLAVGVAVRRHGAAECMAEGRRNRPDAADAAAAAASGGGRLRACACSARRRREAAFLEDALQRIRCSRAWSLGWRRRGANVVDEEFRGMGWPSAPDSGTLRSG